MSDSGESSSVLGAPAMIGAEATDPFIDEKKEPHVNGNERQSVKSVKRGKIFRENIPREDLSIFDEAVEATLISASVFALADLRGLAHKRLISDDDAEEILKLPMTLPRMKFLVEKHKRSWETFKSKDFIGNVEAYREKHQIPAALEVHHVGDESSDKQCVHYIGWSPFRKTIVLVFRGSVTTNDWMQDFKMLISKVPNPLGGVGDQPDTVGIHRGFQNFISLSKHGGATDDHAVTVESMSEPSTPKSPIQALSKMQVIIEELRAMKRKFPSYPVFICGHSLGGALALIAALQICADPLLGGIPSDAPPGFRPVTCYTIGNPKPGNDDFCKAIEHMERTKKLRCCVIHNTWDVIPMLAVNPALSESGFWHPGWKILLYKDRCEIGRGTSATSQLHEEADNPQCSCAMCRCCCCRRQDSRAMWSSSPKGFNVRRAARNMGKQRINTHDHREYLSRIFYQQNHLRGVQLNELYEDM